MVWPVASRFPVATKLWPAPSATAITQKPLRSTVFPTCSKMSSNFTSTSGIRHRSTMSDANAANIATKPASRPISFTMPTPFAALLASTQPLRMTSAASATAESKPKVLSKCRMSLSIDFGTPTMLIVKPRFLASSKSRYAAPCVPSPPTVNNMLIPIFSKVSQILTGSKPPLPAFRMLPPFMWISRTFSVVSATGSYLSGSLKPL
mmetsp:Transcript_72637/g.201409  ORF Transcript_72637/g.201409 Transcript_72637/m.201409 type:complete len:206 (-) Transcript_72637:618-1235(-)